jgi:hypothetical protein
MSPRSLRSPIHLKVTVAIVQCVEIIELLVLILRPKKNDQSHQVTVAAAGGAQARLIGEVGMTRIPAESDRGRTS